MGRQRHHGDACNKLRGSVTATDYVNVVLGLLFLRFAYDKFNTQREYLLADEETADFIDNPRFYSKDNVFFLDETDRWPFIKDNSKSNKIFTYIDDAFRNIEKNNVSLKGALPIGFYITLHIEPSKFSSLIDEIDRIQYSANETDDVIGSGGFMSISSGSSVSPRSRRRGSSILPEISSS